MGYDIDLRSILISDYKKILKKQNLMAARRILKVGIEERFGYFFECGIRTVAELYEKLRDPQEIEKLSEEGFRLDYLTALKKEISTIVPKPVLIADFPHIQPSVFKRLGECCIQTSKDYFDLSDGGSDVGAVCEKTGISEEEAAELCSLCDLIRINGVGPVFSRVLYEAGYRSIEAIAQGQADTLLERVSEINTARNYTRVMLNKDEIQLCIDFAGLISGSISFAGSDGALSEKATCLI